MQNCNVEWTGHWKLENRQCKTRT